MSDNPSVDDEFNAELREIFAAPARRAATTGLVGPSDRSPTGDRPALRDRVLGVPAGVPRRRTPLLVAAFVVLLVAVVAAGVRRSSSGPTLETGSGADPPITAAAPGTTTTIAARKPSGTGAPVAPALPPRPTASVPTTAPTTAPTTTMAPPTTSTSVVPWPSVPAPTTSAVRPVETTAVPTTGPRAPVTAFLDDFADESTEQASHWRAEKGTWLVRQDGGARVLRNEGAGAIETTIVSTGEDSWTAYQADVRFRIGSSSAMGIASMYQGDGDHYLCLVNRMAGELQLWKAVAGFRAAVGHEPYVVPEDGVVHLELTVRNGQLTCQGHDDPNAPPLVFADNQWTSGRLAILATGPGDIQRVEVKA